MNYLIKSPPELSVEEIDSILNAWTVDEFKNLSQQQFVKFFEKSEFHLLYNNDRLVCATRVNFDFKFRINSQIYDIPELVGLVSIDKLKGYGKELVIKVEQNLKKRNLECIGFCLEHNRGFYEKCNINILYGFAKFFREPGIPEDDDVLCVNLSENTLNSLKSLNKDNLAFLEA